MYSYEERIRAVKLYIKLGGRLGSTIRKLVYLNRPGFEEAPNFEKMEP